MRKSVATSYRRDELVCSLLGEQNRYMLYYELVAESFRGSGKGSTGLWISGYSYIHIEQPQA